MFREKEIIKLLTNIDKKLAGILTQQKAKRIKEISAKEG